MNEKMDTANIFEMTGMASSMITCTSSVPQILKMYRTKCTVV
jgi:uncharacterized protein with PQ loop repeat